MISIIRKQIFACICVSSFLLIGCSDNYYEGPLTKNQVLENNPDAKIVEMDDKVYAELDWLYDETFTKGDFVGEIEEGMSNNLPVGAKIYRAKEYEMVLLIEVDGETKRYMAMLGE